MLSKSSNLGEKQMGRAFKREDQPMFLLRLSFRNLGRHKRRALLTASVIAASISIYLIIYSLILGLEETSYQNIINLETGHLKILAEGYSAEKNRLPLNNLIPMDRDLLEELEKVEGSYALRLKAMASLIASSYELPVQAIGVELEQEREVFTTWEYLIEGQAFQGRSQVVMGRSLGYLMELEIGDPITLLFRAKDGVFNTFEATIAGFLHTPHPLINNGIVYLPLEGLREVLRVSKKVSEIIINIAEDEHLLSAAKDLEKRASHRGLSIYTWRDSAGIVLAIAQAGRAENRMILFLLLLIASVGIINTVILSALERAQELGMMKALGMREGEIILSLMLEAFMIGALGGLMGCLLGLVGVYFLTEIGLDIAWLGIEEIDIGIRERVGIPASGRFYGAWSPLSFIFIFLFGSMTSFLASLLPARWAAKKEPAQSIFQK